jgi:hypothetical protein
MSDSFAPALKQMAFAAREGNVHSIALLA